MRQKVSLAAEKNCLFPPGHFYSPVPDIELIRQDSERIFKSAQDSLPGIELRAGQQQDLLARFQTYYPDIPWLDEKKDGLRYHFKNPAYSYTDAIFLYSMIRHSRPKRIIEIGSGFSSCVTLDTNELFFDSGISCTFIEPFPKLLLSLLRPSEVDSIRLLDSRVQDVSLDVYDELEEGDILFVDSTHVSKTGSDVNHIFFNVLPRLRPGVLIHFHDIFYPFEYPEKWVVEGRAWNENYILRAFLQFNREFQIELFASYLATFKRKLLVEHLPLCAGNFGGNIWLRKVNPAGA